MRYGRGNQPKKQTMNVLWARLISESSKIGFRATTGFALCQLWLTLCFFVPEMFPNNASTRIQEISLVVRFICLLPCIFCARRLEPLLSKKGIGYGLAGCACVGTILVPLSGGDSAFSFILQLSAGILTGLASGWLFMMWYQVFCKTKDPTGLISSVVASSILTYIVGAIIALPSVSSWVMVGISALMPFASIFLFTEAKQDSKLEISFEFPRKKTQQRRSLILLCCGLFAVSFVDEFMRNYYVSDVGLAFHSSGLHLILLIAKILCFVFIVAALSETGHRISVMYRAAFILTMIAVMFMPYTQNISDIMYGLTNFGAFFLNLMILLLAYNFHHRHRVSSVLVFALVRAVFCLDLLLGYLFYQIFSSWEAVIPDLLGITSVVLGLMVIVIYLFVFTEKDNIPIYGKSDAAPSRNASADEACLYLSQLGKLSKREAEVFGLIAKGRSTPRIQKELQLSMNTVNTHTRHIFQKLDVHSRQELLDLIDETILNKDGKV